MTLVAIEELPDTVEITVCVTDVDFLIAVAGTDDLLTFTSVCLSRGIHSVAQGFILMRHLVFFSSPFSSF